MNEAVNVAVNVAVNGRACYSDSVVNVKDVTADGCWQRAVSR